MITEAEFRKQLKSGLKGGYLFFGEEDYLKGIDLSGARKAVSPDEAFGFFNDLRLDAISFSPEKLLDALMPLPMGSEQKIVSVSGLALSSLRPAEIEGLTDALAALKEYDYNVLILSVPSGMMDYGILPKRPSALLQKLSEHLTPVYFERSTPAKLAAWCEKHFRHRGVSASAEICRMLIEQCGTDMFLLSNEVDKVCFYVLSHGLNEVSADDIRYVAVTSGEYDAFAFANALTEGRQADALAVLGDMKRRRVEPIAALSEIIRVFCDLYTVLACTEDGKSVQEIRAETKMHEYRIGLYQRSARASGKDRLLRALGLLAEADALLKQSPTDGYAAIERVICCL